MIDETNSISNALREIILNNPSLNISQLTDKEQVAYGRFRQQHTRVPSPVTAESIVTFFDTYRIEEIITKGIRAVRNEKRKLLALEGPDGVGKSTFAKTLSSKPEFIVAPKVDQNLVVDIFPGFQKCWFEDGSQDALLTLMFYTVVSIKSLHTLLRSAQRRNGSFLVLDGFLFRALFKGLIPLPRSFQGRQRISALLGDFIRILQETNPTVITVWLTADEEILQRHLSLRGYREATIMQQKTSRQSFSSMAKKYHHTLTVKQIPSIIIHSCGVERQHVKNRDHPSARVFTESENFREDMDAKVKSLKEYLDNDFSSIP